LNDKIKKKITQLKKDKKKKKTLVNRPNLRLKSQDRDNNIEKKLKKIIILNQPNFKGLN
jgi:tRNA G37 N-methylase TrmD